MFERAHHFKSALLGLVLTACGVSAAYAQDSQRTDDRFCQQYASSTADVANEAISRNPGCLDFSRGVHGVYAMHYDWCLRNSRDTVWGAADHIRNLAAQCSGQGNGNGNGYGNGNAGGNPAPEPRPEGSRTYAQFGNWEVIYWPTGACSAQLTDYSKGQGGGRMLRFDADYNGFWLLSDQLSDTFPASALIDGQFYPMTLSIIGDTTSTPVDRNFLAAVQRGNRMNLNFDPEGPEYTLSGSSRAIDSMLECAGLANQPKPAKEPYVLLGSCKLIVDGQTYVNMPNNCPIWMANDGTGTFWINTNRDTYLGEYFAEISPFGNGFAGGHWNGMRGSTHAQAFLGEDFRQSTGGCWVNARATICAAR